MRGLRRVMIEIYGDVPRYTQHTKHREREKRVERRQKDEGSRRSTPGKARENQPIVEIIRGGAFYIFLDVASASLTYSFYDLQKIWLWSAEMNFFSGTLYIWYSIYAIYVDDREAFLGEFTNILRRNTVIVNEIENWLNNLWSLLLMKAYDFSSKFVSSQY